MRFVRFNLLLGVLFGAAHLGAQSIPILTQPFPSQSLAPGGDALTIDLRNHIVVPGVRGTKFAKFETVLGSFAVELREDVAPRHVANFLAYVQAGAYTNTFIHRAASFENGPISIVQGGGYRSPLPPTTIPKRAPVALEYNLANARGTLAAARTSELNSATSEWFFNVRDNSTILNQSNGGGYTVFGGVLGGGMAVIDAMAAVPRFNGGRDFPEVPLRNYTSGDPTEAHLVLVTAVREATLFPTGGGASVVEFTVENSAPTVVTALLSGSTLTLTPGAPGTATIRVRATDASGSVTDGSFAVIVAGEAPVFMGQPRGLTVAAGSTLAFYAPATGAARYVWKRDNVDLPGATTGILVLKNVSAADAGGYVAYASNTFGTTVSEAGVVRVEGTEAGRLINLSILTPLAAGESMTMGTVLGGASTSGPKPLLARAAGPSLAQLGVTGFLPDPAMTLVSTSVTPNTTVAANNDWGGGAALSNAFAQVGAFGYTSARDAAIFQGELAPGNYTVQVNDAGTGSGTVIAELYDSSGAAFSTATPRLINVSVLKQISEGTALTAGFVVGGTTAKTVLIRAVGPTLGAAPFGLGGVMADPRLRLYSGQFVIASNDDWGGNLDIMSAAESVGAFRLVSGMSRDAVLMLTLPPGNYSAQVVGANDTGGTAIVEVYEVP